MLKVLYNEQEWDAIGIYDANSSGTIAVLVGVRLFLSGSGSYTDPIPVSEVEVIGGAGGAGAGVSSINTLDGAVTLAAGTNVTLTPAGNTITIAATAGTPGSNSVTTAMIQDGAITSGKIANGTIQPADIAAGPINTYMNTNGSGVVGWVELPSASGVASFNSRTGIVTPQAGDYNAGQVGAIPDDFYGAADGVAPLDSSAKVPYSYLPIGTAANTIARGDDPRFGLAGFISRSSSAPSSPAAGDVWFRYLDSGFTQFDEAFAYVTAAGANAWRSLNRYPWEFAASGSPPEQGFLNPFSGKTWWSSFEASLIVSTTNNGSNYWVITLRSLSSASALVQTLATISTAAIAPNTWNELGGLINGGDGVVVDANGTERIISVNCTAVGSPGALTYASTGFYRRQWTP